MILVSALKMLPLVMMKLAAFTRFEATHLCVGIDERSGIVGQCFERGFFVEAVFNGLFGGFPKTLICLLSHCMSGKNGNARGLQTAGIGWRHFPVFLIP